MAKKARKVYKVEDWPGEQPGRFHWLNARGWCETCRSCWCPGAAPSLYKRKG